VDRFEESREGGGAFAESSTRRWFAAGCYFLRGGGSGVGVLVWNLGVHFFSMDCRMATGSAPDRYIIIASRATSMHTAQP
jgi:hypothetical protein